MRVIIQVEGVSRTVELTSEDITRIRIERSGIEQAHLDARLIVANWAEGCLDIDLEALADPEPKGFVPLLDRAGIHADDDPSRRPL